MTFLEAAVAVLDSAGRALTVEELTSRALQRGLISTKGNTPVATMSAVLYTQVRDNPKTRLTRIFEPGDRRAKRGSVHWRLK